MCAKYRTTQKSYPRQAIPDNSNPVAMLAMVGLATVHGLPLGLVTISPQSLVMSHNITREQALVSLMRLQALGVTDMEIKNFRPSDTCLTADFNGLD